MNKDEIGKCVRMALAKSNQKQVGLAKKMGVTRQSVFGYTKGDCTSVTILGVIAGHCDMSLVEMLILAQ